MSDFKFPEPGDDKIPTDWAKSPPWKDDPDLPDLIGVMQPLERDYWSEGGQSHSEREEFLARIETRWRRWRDLTWQRMGRIRQKPKLDLTGTFRQITEDRSQTERKPPKPRESPIPRSPTKLNLKALEDGVDRATKVMGEAAEILRRKDSNQPPRPDPQPSPDTDSVSELHQHAILASASASSLGAIALNILNQKYGTLVPDWLILLLVYAAVSFWLYAVWHIKEVRHARLLLYTSYPRMFLSILVIGGAIMGAAAGAGLWVVNRNEHRMRAAVRPNEEQPAPGSSPALTPPSQPETKSASPIHIPTTTQSPASSSPSPLSSPSLSATTTPQSSPRSTPINSYMYARFLGGDKNPLGVRKTYKIYHTGLRTQLELEAHFAVRYADPRPRLEIYTKHPIPYGHAAFLYAIDHYAEIKKQIADESGFTEIETSGLLTIYPDFPLSEAIIVSLVDKARQKGITVQVVWDQNNGRQPNNPNPWAP
jgi:hypothetical protein